MAQTHEEIRAFARRLVEGDKRAVAMGFKGFWKDLAREMLAATTETELDAVGKCIAGYNRKTNPDQPGRLEQYPQYKILIDLGKSRRLEIKAEKEQSKPK